MSEYCGGKAKKSEVKSLLSESSFWFVCSSEGASVPESKLKELKGCSYGFFGKGKCDTFNVDPYLMELLGDKEVSELYVTDADESPGSLVVKNDGFLYFFDVRKSDKLSRNSVLLTYIKCEEFSGKIPDDFSPYSDNVHNLGSFTPKYRKGK